MPILLSAQLFNLLVIPLNAITQRRRQTHQRHQRVTYLGGNCLLYPLCKARAGTLGEPRAHTLYQDSSPPTDRSHGGTHFHRLDLRSSASACKKGEGSASADAARHLSGQEEERI